MGAGGLIRAYQNTIKEVIAKTEIVPYKEMVSVSLTAPFSDEKLLKNICKDYEVLNEEYNQEIKYVILIEKESLDNLKLKITNTNIKIVL